MSHPLVDQEIIDTMEIEDHAPHCRFDSTYICTCGARARNLERYMEAEAKKENDV